MNFKNIEFLIFLCALATFLFPVWTLDFFVTGDGPCHLYNSRILLDWWQEKKGFYDPFYYLNTNFDPNWAFNLITFPLLSVFDRSITEKIFFTIYFTGFAFGFRYLISGINPNAKFISTIGLLFCMHKLLMTGFLNNTLSFAIWFWVVGWWWRNRNNFNLRFILTGILLFLGLYSSHPIGLSFCLMMLVSLVLGLVMYESIYQDKRTVWSLFSKRIAFLAISMAPSLILFAEYLFRSNLSASATAHNIEETIKNILNLYSLIAVDFSETTLALLTSLLTLIVFIVSLILRIRKKGLVEADGLLLFVGLVMITIIHPPGSISGGLEISFRMAIIPNIALLCWSATADFPKYLQLALQSIAFVFCLGFIFIRYPVHQNASKLAAEIYTVDPHIGDSSTVFVLNYDWAGRTPENEPISDRTWLFGHVDCYLGVDKTLVISDNYESHFPYFPIVARWNTDMYSQTDKDQINFDHRPPRADILSYNRRTKQNIDYVLMVSYREEFKDHPYTVEIFEQLNQAYTKTFTSDHARAILYKRNDL